MKKARSRAGLVWMKLSEHRRFMYQQSGLIFGKRRGKYLVPRPSKDADRYKHQGSHPIWGAQSRNRAAHGSFWNWH